MVAKSVRHPLVALLVIPLLSLAPAASAQADVGATGRDTSSSVAQRGNGEVKTNKSCRPGRYETRYRITSAHRAPRITQIKAYYLPPSGRRKTTKWASFYVRLKSSVKLNSSTSIGASGVAKVLAKAETEVNMQLKAAGEVTARGSVKVTDWISNPTNQNKKFVFFKGWEHASGGFRQYFCKIYYLPGQSYGPAFVTYRPGKWRSYNISGQGALRCGAGAPDNGLGKAALRIGC